MKLPWRRRKHAPEDGLHVLQKSHGYMIESFKRHRYGDDEAKILADIAFEGWLDFIREEM